MIRRKSLHSQPPPNYNGSESFYTLKLTHGGMVLNDACKIEYLGGNVSIFDFIDGKMWGLNYLNGLCVTLGYQGSKSLLACFSGKLQPLETDYHALTLKEESQDRKLEVYVVSTKNALNLLEVLENDDDVVEGVSRDEGNDVAEGVKSKNMDVSGEVRSENVNGEGSENDEEFYLSDVSCDNMLDDVVFDENIDFYEEFDGLDKKESSDDDDDSTGDVSDDSFESLPTDDDDSNVVDTSSSSRGRSLALGKKYSTKSQFRAEVNDYAVKIGKSCNFPRNDDRRIYAKCKKIEECGWHIHALKVKKEESWQIRAMDLTHSCGRQFQVDNAKSSWLAKHFETSFRCDPKKTARGFRNTAMSELGIQISHQQAYRTRQKALKKIEGESTDQYSILWDYAEVIREKNPGSTVILQLETTATVKNFKAIYVCLAAVKNGFRLGCRPWIGVDGCHLSGPNAGVLLTAVGMDPNNDPYPLSYAVVGSENRESWEWFLTLLKEDFVIERESIYTFMSDKQKGLLAAFEKVMPNVDNRFCVRHLHGNMKSAGFKGDVFKKLLWKAAHATTVVGFTRVMEEIEKKDSRLFAWLQGKPAREWSKSHFTLFGKCDTLVNNMCEQINKCLLDARDKPIVTMLEWIRQFIMKRLEKNSSRAERLWEGRLLCPKIANIVNEMTKGANDCLPIKSSTKRYEVLCNVDGSRVGVDLGERTCDCRRWQLSGIPCIHAASAISADGGEAQDYVHNSYTVETYSRVYSHAITAMYGPELWKKTGYLPPLPPNFHKKKKSGRPQKKRRHGACESPKGKSNKQPMTIQSLGKQQFKVKCSFCGEIGHNRAGCAARKEAEREAARDLTSTNTSGCTVKTVIADEFENEAEHQPMEEGASELYITQPEFTTTQDTQEDILTTLVIPPPNPCNVIKPTTRKGRKELAHKRLVMSSFKKKKGKSATSGSEPYSISNSLKETSTQASQTKEQPAAPTNMYFKSSHLPGKI